MKHSWAERSHWSDEGRSCIEEPRPAVLAVSGAEFDPVTLTEVVNRTDNRQEAVIAVKRSLHTATTIRYSEESAPSTSRRAARRAGSCAASTPASAARISSTTSVPTGIEST